MAKWTMRSYAKVLRAARARYGLTLADARKFYRGLRDLLGRSVFGTDVPAHPKLSKRVADDVRFVAAPVPPFEEPTPTLPPTEAEWEATIYYPDEHGKVQDITLVLAGPTRLPDTGLPTTEADVRRAVWRLLLGREMAVFRLVGGIVWQSGPRRYTYPTVRVELQEALEQMRGIVHTVTMAGIRIGKPEILS